jgi:hypothetical protein
MIRIFGDCQYAIDACRLIALHCDHSDVEHPTDEANVLTGQSVDFRSRR